SAPTNGSFGYAVKAVDKAGNASLASRAPILQVDATAPPAPEDVNALTPTTLPTTTWRPVSGAATGGSAVAPFRVYRDRVFVGEATTPSYTDGKLALSGQYVYTVRSIDAAGNISAMSAGREVILDADGPILDAISFPQKTTAGT